VTVGEYVSTMGDSCLTISDLYNYSCADKGLILPLVSEYTWPYGVRAFLYLIGMLWCFLGIAIAADVFMCAIEKITSYTRTIKIASPDPETIGFEEVEVKVDQFYVAKFTCWSKYAIVSTVLSIITDLTDFFWDTLRIFTFTLYGKTKTNTNPNPDPNAMIQKKELQIKTEEDGKFKAEKYKIEIEMNILNRPTTQFCIILTAKKFSMYNP